MEEEKEAEKVAKEATERILTELLGMTFNEQNHINTNLYLALGNLNPQSQPSQVQRIWKTMGSVASTFSKLWEDRHKYKLTDPTIDFLKDDLERAVKISGQISSSATSPDAACRDLENKLAEISDKFNKFLIARS